jgi:sugar (pentulose or hexulose) kinase
MGLWILEECERFWKARDLEMDKNMLHHFAGETPPFESLVDFNDPRFQTPGDMPLKIQQFCRETGQTVPRKPGAVVRCILESLALLYRKTLEEMESLTGRKITRLYVLDGQENSLLNHFTANALQVPVVVVAPGSGAAGNLMVQALALGHVKAREEAREILRNSIKTKTLAPHANNWTEAFVRLSSHAGLVH